MRIFALEIRNNRVMKIRLGILFFVTVFCFMSCGNRKTAEAEDKAMADSLPPDEMVHNGVIQLQPSHVVDTVSWKGQIYHYDILREPDTTLAKVKDGESGSLFSDNHIDLVVSCQNKIIFKNRFYKSSFNNFLEEGLKKNGILEGLVFDEALPEGLRFATSVSYPGSDLYVPLVVLVNKDGEVSVSKDKILDSDSEDTEE